MNSVSLFGEPAMPPAFTESTATFSPCQTYRYTLSRVWEPSLPRVLFIMLNPSVATADILDPTCRRCVGFARRWGFGGLTVCNLFALRSTDPRELYKSDEPVGPGNDEAIRSEAGRASKIVAAWGVHGKHRDRADEVERMLVAVGLDLWHLGLTLSGHPRHPLYVSGDTELTLWG